jgi:hypothetical protein
MSTNKFTLRLKDRLAFRDAAAFHHCWILVRATNVASLNYIEDPLYTPKPIDCKPKTADADTNGKNLAGLVIVPAIYGPPAFHGNKFPKAVSCWDSFRQSQNIQACYDPKFAPRDRSIKEAEALSRANSDYRVDLDQNSKHFGCLQFRGKWLHGDFDLKDIILEGQERRNLASVEELRGQPHMRGPSFFKVRDFVNARLGKEMIQHAGEAQYADHSNDTIDVFGPHGEQNQLSTVAEISQWYQRYQREVIDLKKGGASRVPDPTKTPEQYRAGFRVLPGGKR